MGTLENFALDIYGCNIFIETGTGMGDGLAYAKKYPFKRFYSFEIHPEIFNLVKGMNDKKTHVFNCTGLEGLSLVLPKLQEDDKCLFWLDAHFPGKDFGYEMDAREEDITPLYEELEFIKEVRGNQDVILADDMRLYDKLKIDGMFDDVVFLNFDEGYVLINGEGECKILL